MSRHHRNQEDSTSEDNEHPQKMQYKHCNWSHLNQRDVQIKGVHNLVNINMTICVMEIRFGLFFLCKFEFYIFFPWECTKQKSSVETFINILTKFDYAFTFAWSNVPLHLALPRGFASSREKEGKTIVNLGFNKRKKSQPVKLQGPWSSL